MKDARGYRDLFVTGEGELQKLKENIETLTQRRKARLRLQETLESIFGRDALPAMSEEDVVAKLEAMPKQPCAYCLQPRPTLVGSNGLKVVLCNLCQRADAANGPEAKPPGMPVMGVR